MSAVKSSISTAPEIIQAKFDIWVATLGKTANENTKLTAELKSEQDQMAVLTKGLAVAQSAYEKMKAIKGENAAETQELYLELLKETEAQGTLQTKIDATTESIKKQAAATIAATAASVVTSSKSGQTYSINSSGTVTKVNANSASEVDAMASKHGVDRSVADSMVTANKTGGKRVYHDGGPVGKLASDEVPAILQLGEWVLSKKMLANLNSISSSSKSALSAAGKEIHLHVENHGTIVGSNGMKEFAKTVSKEIAGQYGLATGGAF
jgi:hypothetical protein